MLRARFKREQPASTASCLSTTARLLKPLPINLVIEIFLLYIHSENHHHAKKYKQSTFPFISCISCISPQ